jgi:hypothetical protein
MDINQLDKDAQQTRRRPATPVREVSSRVIEDGLPVAKQQASGGPQPSPTHQGTPSIAAVPDFSVSADSGREEGVERVRIEHVDHTLRADRSQEPILSTTLPDAPLANRFPAPVEQKLEPFLVSQPVVTDPAGETAGDLEGLVDVLGVAPTPSAEEGVADSVGKKLKVGISKFRVPRFNAGPVVKKVQAAIGRIRAREAAKKAAKDQRAADENNKKSNTRKNNPFKLAAVVMVAGIVLTLVAKKSLNGVERKAGVSAQNARGKQAVQAATDLLDGAAVRPAATGQSPAGESKAASAPGQPQLANAGVSPSANFVPPASRSVDDDPYMRQMEELKGELKSGRVAGNAPSKLPKEIASAEVPQNFRGGGDPSAAPAPRHEQIPVPDTVEGAEVSPRTPVDPLDRVAVVGMVSVDRSSTAPYLMGQVRPTVYGAAVFLYSKNSDPLLTGRWYVTGDQTGEGWTIVAISPQGVNVVSPKGKVYQINSAG